MTRRIVTRYTIASPRVTQDVTFAILADLHNGPYEEFLPQLQEADAVLVPGDLLNRHRLGWENAERFIAEVPKLRPVFYSLGNHERKYPAPERRHWLKLVKRSDVVLLDDSVTTFAGVSLGGLTSVRRPEQMNRQMLAKLAAMPGFRLLLCHHPEYYPAGVKDYDLDLVVAGHAHGGQVQCFGRGLYAPGQGFFPRLTDGFYYDNRLLVSRGATNSASAPRLFNPCEIIMLKIEKV